MKSDNHGIVRAAGTIGFATFLSRILGFVRDMLIAKALGTGWQADAFFVSFRIPNLLRLIVGEGAVSSSIVPVLTKSFNSEGEEKTWRSVNILSSFLLVLFLALSILGIFLTPYIVKLIAPGFSSQPEKFDLTVSLTRITFPFILFIGMAALAGGILNSCKLFFLPAIAPAFMNLTIISFIFLLTDIAMPYKLALGVTAGGLAQFLVQSLGLFKKGFRFRWIIDIKDQYVRESGRLFLPSLIGVAPYQINLFVNTLFASFLQDGSVSYLYYGNRLVQFPLGIFGIATSVAVLPMMAEHAAKGDYEKMKDAFSFAVKFALMITIPASVGLIALRVPIINLLFEHGEFTRSSALGTSEALLYYSVGLGGFSLVKVASSAFYSILDTKTPLKVGLYIMVFNIFLSPVLMFFLGHGGLALATSVSIGVNAVILVLILRQRIGNLGGKDILISIIKSLLTALIMAIFIIYLSDVFYADTASRAYRGLALLLIMTIGIAIYIVFSVIIKHNEMIYLIRLVKEKLKR